MWALILTIAGGVTMHSLEIEGFRTKAFCTSAATVLLKQYENVNGFVKATCVQKGPSSQ
jgi:hypothetical protein